MITVRTFRTMLVTGVAVIVAGLVGELIIASAFSNEAANRELGMILTLMSTLFSLMSLAGCGFVALSLPALALAGRRISSPAQRPRSAIVLLIGLAAVAVGLASTWLVQGLWETMAQSQTGRDLLTVAGWTLVPLFGNVIPTLGALAVPTSVLLRALERGPAPLDPHPVFSGSRPRPGESPERAQP